MYTFLEIIVLNLIINEFDIKVKIMEFKKED